MSRIPKSAGNPGFSRLPQDVTRRASTSKIEKSHTKIKNDQKLSCAKTEPSLLKKTHQHKKTNSVTKQPAVVPIPPPSVLRKQMSLQVKEIASRSPKGSKITAVGTKRSQVVPLKKILTPAGLQRVKQNIVWEKRVEKTKFGEIFSKNIKVIEKDAQSGKYVKIEEEMQKLNPDFPASKGTVKEIVAVIDEKNITDSYEMTRENYIREIMKLEAELGIDPKTLSILIKEEREDVQSVLKLVIPKLENDSSTLFPSKKRLQGLISPENMAMLAKSIVNPPAHPDEAILESTPEFFANIVENLEIGDSPVGIFNWLFKAEGKNYPLIHTSSATPGLMADVLVPFDIPEIVLESMRTTEIENTALRLQNTAKEKPPLDSFSILKPSKARKKKRRKLEFSSISEEKPPWDWNDMSLVVEAVGSFPKSNLNTSNLEEVLAQNRLRKETLKGIEYLVDCDPLQYYSRVQLRGSQPPVSFPGYMVALSNTSLRVAKSPSEVLFSAWRSVQPEIFPEDSILYN